MKKWKTPDIFKRKVSDGPQDSESPSSSVKAGEKQSSPV